MKWVVILAVVGLVATRSCGVPDHPVEGPGERAIATAICSDTLHRPLQADSAQFMGIDHYRFVLEDSTHRTYCITRLGRLEAVTRHRVETR